MKTTDRDLGYVFVVSSGCYSDYRMLAVCGDEATAEAWADALCRSPGSFASDARVESLPLVPAGREPFTCTTYLCDVTLWDDGRVDRKHVWSETELPIAALYGPPPSRPYVRYVRAPMHKDKGGRLEVRGATREAVEKVVTERIAQWRAGAWAGPGHSEIQEGGDDED